MHTRGSPTREQRRSSSERSLCPSGCGRGPGSPAARRLWAGARGLPAGEGPGWSPGMTGGKAWAARRVPKGRRNPPSLE